jgi:hypothetical protein
MSDDHTKQEIWLLLQSLISKLDQFMHDNHEAHCQMRETLQTHNGRLRKVEIWRAYMTGAMAVLISITALVAIPLFVKSFTLTPTQAVTINDGK